MVHRRVGKLRVYQRRRYIKVRRRHLSCRRHSFSEIVCVLVCAVVRPQRLRTPRSQGLRARLHQVPVNGELRSSQSDACRPPCALAVCASLSRAWAFWFRPRIRAALIQGCQEHFSDPKCPIGKWSNFNPPHFGSSAVKLATPDLDRNRKLSHLPSVTYKIDSDW